MNKKKTKPKYRIRNWRDYNKALVGRGSLTLWIDEASLKRWNETVRTGRRGAPQLYADAAILCCLMLREVYHLPLRATEGLALSVIKLLNVKAAVAHYSTLCRRARHLPINIASDEQKIKHLVIDSTGLKVYGEGEWKVRLHGADKRRTWRKLHISLNAETSDLTAARLTDKDELDRKVLPSLVEQTAAEIEIVCADGAYDFAECYRAIRKCQAKALIPPRRDAVLRGKSPFEQRDENLRQVRKLGRSQWKKRSTYHRRSLVETAFFRLKAIFSDRLRSRRTDTQAAEAIIRCAALNRMTKLGMPQSYAV